MIMRATGRVAGLSVFERHHYRLTQKPRLLVDERDIFEVPERIDHLGRRSCRRWTSRRWAKSQRDRCEPRLRGRRDRFPVLAQELRPRAPRARILEPLLPDVHLSLSCEVAPVMGEYERSATALFNAYVGPVIEGYLDRLGAHPSRRRGLRQKLLIVQANGGVATTAQTVPIFTIESGPAAGVVGARRLAGALGHRRRDRDRCRRHDVQGRDHRGRSMGLQPRDRAEPVPASPADGGRRLDRRRRRLDRVGRRAAGCASGRKAPPPRRDRRATDSAARSRR